MCYSTYSIYGTNRLLGFHSEYRGVPYRDDTSYICKQRYCDCNKKLVAIWCRLLLCFARIFAYMDFKTKQNGLLWTGSVIPMNHVCARTFHCSVDVSTSWYSTILRPSSPCSSLWSSSDSSLPIVFIWVGLSPVLRIFTIRRISNTNVLHINVKNNKM